MEFFYRIPGIHEGIRPGAHRSRSPGAGQEFTGHLRLFDAPDVRQLDLKASLQDLRGDWLVRAPRQRSALRIHSLVDVSPSMTFQAGTGSKLSLCADIVSAIGTSASRSGDLASLDGFDDGRREDLHVPPSAARGVGLLMAALLGELAATSSPDRTVSTDGPGHGAGQGLGHGAGPRAGHSVGHSAGVPRAQSRAASGRHRERGPWSWLRPGGRHAGPARGTGQNPTADFAGLAECLALAHDADLIFLLSDFHGPLEAIGPALTSIEHALVVPVVIWSRLEIEPPPRSGLVSLADLESGELRQLWVDEPLRAEWRSAVTARRAAIDAAFRGRGAAPLYVIDHFEPERFSRYFMEEIA